ncbi:hypothetical protein CAY35_03150 [Pseudoglutamicibacter cumminsii]|uniref:Uncharacterized protein n=1 Tax=Pseudoglutamicibacter cumminsii TaxID=156979 RepID=A0ABX5L8E8_9MICC|nr:hypothetical protein CAY35_03150 [Pseudoglutamicibacter cumminsii]
MRRCSTRRCWPCVRRQARKTLFPLIERVNLDCEAVEIVSPGASWPGRAISIGRLPIARR